MKTKTTPAEYQAQVEKIMSEKACGRWAALAIIGETEGVTAQTIDRRINGYSKPARRQVVEYVSPSEWAALRAVKRRGHTNTRDRAILSLMYYGGLRVSEVVNLTLDQVVPSDGGIYILRLRKTKWSGARNIALPAIGGGDLAKWLAAREMVAHESSPDNVFLSTASRGGVASAKKGSAIGTDNVIRMVRKLAARAGLKGITPHKFRHAAATERANKGWTVPDLQAFLGHRRPETVLIYLHSSTGRAEQLTEALAAGY